MDRYLKTFGTVSQYETYIESDDKLLPNVSLVDETEDVYYKSDKPVPEKRIIATFDVTSTSNFTKIADSAYLFKEIEIDDEVLPEVVGTYRFSTTGEHTVKYTLKEEISIGYRAFYNCTRLVDIIIPDNIVYIGKEAFKGCNELTSIPIGNNITSIGEYAYGSCYGATSLVLPDGISNISENAFRYCSGLTSLMIPRSLTNISDRAFNSCDKIASIIVEDGNPKYDSRNNCNAIIETASNTLLLGCKNTTILDSITGIGDYAFYGSGLTSVTIPSSVTSIGRYAFCNCNDIITVTIPDSVTNIGVYAFMGCYNLSTVNLPSNITSIPDHLFDSSGSFNAITIPSTVTSIGSYAFNNCYRLTSVVIPSGVTSIGERAFQFCQNLINVTVEATTPPTLGNDAFNGGANNRKIYVPSASVNDYITSYGWSTYASEIEAIS